MGRKLERLTFCDQVLLVRIQPVEGCEVGGPVGGAVSVGQQGGGLGAGALEETTEHAALLTDALGEGAGVDTGDGGHALLLEPGAQRGSGEVVGVLFTGICGHDQAGDVDLAGLEVGGQVVEQVVHFVAGGHAIIADEGEGDDENLAAIRRVSDGLGIAHHARLEDELTGNALVGAEALAEADVAVLQLEGHVLPCVPVVGHVCRIDVTARGLKSREGSSLSDNC